MKRLYEVTAVVSAYILAESPKEAINEGAFALVEEARHADPSARLVEKDLKDWHRVAGWGPASLVYGAGDEEVTLSEALKKYTEGK